MSEQEPGKSGQGGPADQSAGPASGNGFAWRAFITIGIAIVLGLVLVLFYFALFVLLLVFAGILLAIVLHGLATFLGKYTQLSYHWSLAVVGVAVIGLIVGTGFLIAPPVAEQIDKLASELPRAFREVQRYMERYEWTRYLLAEPTQDGVARAPDMLARATGFVTTTFAAIAYLVIILFVGIYLAYDPALYIRGTLRLVPLHHRPRAREVLAEIGYTLRWWLIGRGISMLAVGVMTYIGLRLLGMPLALTLGILAGILDFIPNIGPIIAAVPAVLIALMEGPQQAFAVIIVYTIVQQIESFLITPIVQQRAIHMPPALTITAQVLMGLMAGVLGLTLATPLAAVAMVAVQMLYVRDTLGDREMTSPSEDTS